MKLTIDGDSPEGAVGYINVAVRRDLHERANERAMAKNKSVRQYESELLEMALDKVEFMGKYAPLLSFHSTDGESIWISDDKRKALVEVKMMKNKRGYNDSYCLADKDFGCIHAKYALLIPEINRLKW